MSREWNGSIAARMRKIENNSSRESQRGSPALNRRVVIQIGTEPSFDFSHAHTLTLMIVGDLIAVDLPQAEIARLRVCKIEPADARSRPHGERLGNHHARVRLDIEQAPDR